MQLPASRDAADGAQVLLLVVKKALKRRQQRCCSISKMMHMHVGCLSKSSTTLFARACARDSPSNGVAHAPVSHIPAYSQQQSHLQPYSAAAEQTDLQPMQTPLETFMGHLGSRRVPSSRQQRQQLGWTALQPLQAEWQEGGGSTSLMHRSRRSAELCCTHDSAFCSSRDSCCSYAGKYSHHAQRANPPSLRGVTAYVTSAAS